MTTTIRSVWRVYTAVTVALLFMPAEGLAQAKEYLYVENARSGDVAIVSVPEHEIVGRIPASVVGNHPDDVMGSNSGEMIFIPRQGTKDVLVLSTADDQVLFRVPVSGTPHHVTVSRDDRWLYVPMFNDTYLEVIDLEQRKVVAQVPTSWGGHGTQLSPDGQRVYVGNILAPRLTIFEVGTNRVVKAIEVPEGVRPFKISRDERKVYAQLSKLHGFVEIDVESGRITKTIHLPTLGKVVPQEVFNTFPFSIGHGMEISPEGDRLYVAATVYDFVAVYSLPDLELLGTVETGKEPGWLAISKDGRFIYSSNRGDNTLSVIDAKQIKEVKRIPDIGDFPQRASTVLVPRRTVVTTPPD
jgi:YVTN family beta-propeller protein